MLRLQIFPQPFKQNASVLVYDLTENVENLSFGTNAFGGYASCSFTLKYNFDVLWAMLEDVNGRGLLCRRIEIVDDFGETVYRGLVSDMVIDLGGQVFSRTLENTYTGVRLNHAAPTHGMWHRFTTDYDWSSVQRYGMKVFVEEDFDFLSKVWEDTALSRVNRTLAMFSTPPRVKPVRFGEMGETISMQVDGVGLHSTLGWRYAWNSFRTKRIYTNELIEQMLKAGPFGTTGVPSYPASNVSISDEEKYWVELMIDDYDTHVAGGPYTGNGYFPWGQQFISTDFSRIKESNILCATNLSSGENRLNIIQAALEQGGANDRRMLFMVWEDPASGKGLAHFRKQDIDVPYTAGYNGYYYGAKNDLIFNKHMTPIPFWQVRAGKWLTVTDVVLASQIPEPTGEVSDVFRRPDTFWIEETSYDVDGHKLTVSTTNDFDLRRIVSHNMTRLEMKSTWKNKKPKKS
jgi:hypothetical protein